MIVGSTMDTTSAMMHMLKQYLRSWFSGKKPKDPVYTWEVFMEVTGYTPLREVIYGTENDVRIWASAVSKQNINFVCSNGNHVIKPPSQIVQIYYRKLT